MKPFIVQELSCGGPISGVEFHDLQHEFPVLLTNLSCSCEMKGPQRSRRAFLHNPHKNRQSLLVRYLLVRFWEGAEASMMLHENFHIILIMVYRDIGLENMESIPIKETDKLQHRWPLLSRSNRSVIDFRLTIVPNDQISVAVPHFI